MTVMTIAEIKEMTPFSAEKYLEKYTDLDELSAFTKKQDYSLPFKENPSKVWEYRGLRFWMSEKKSTYGACVHFVNFAVPVNKNGVYEPLESKVFKYEVLTHPHSSWGTFTIPEPLMTWSRHALVHISNRRPEMNILRFIRRKTITPAVKKRRQDLKALIGSPEYEQLRLTKQQILQTSAIVEVTKELTRLRAVVDDMLNGLSQSNVSRELLSRYSNTLYEFGTYRGKVTKPIRAAFVSSRKKKK